MTEYGTRWEDIGTAVAQLTDEEKKQGERLLRRSDALITAYLVVEGDFMPNAEIKAETLIHLKEMREEANAEVQRFREEQGIPEPVAPVVRLRPVD